MIKKFIYIFVLTSGLLLGSQANAQNVTIEGTVMDSSSKKTLISATVSIAKATDSSLLNFTRADEDGFFRFKNI